MPLKNMALTAGGTIAVTGGSALAFTDDGVSIPNGVHLVVPADTDYQTRRSVTAKVKPTTLNPKTNTYGKDRKSISYTIPALLPDGTVVFNVWRCERELHPSMSTTDAVEGNKIAAQLFVDSYTSGFWGNGSLS